MTDFKISEADVARFQADGAIHFPAVFGSEWVDKIRSGIQVGICRSGSGHIDAAVINTIHISFTPVAKPSHFDGAPGRKRYATWALARKMLLLLAAPPPQHFFLLF
jgi:hypothetical protein